MKGPRGAIVVAAIILLRLIISNTTATHAQRVLSGRQPALTSFVQGSPKQGHLTLAAVAFCNQQFPLPPTQFDSLCYVTGESLTNDIDLGLSLMMHRRV